MPDADVGTFAVTPSALLELARGVSSIRAQLDATRDVVDEVSSALGSPAVAAALEHFVSGWRDGRKQISTEVGALSDMLAQAADAYADTDTSLAAAIPEGPS
jgi:uncharacterized protein YukE